LIRDNRKSVVYFDFDICKNQNFNRKEGQGE